MVILSVLMRVTLTFSVLLVLTRLTGKKQLSQSTFFDFITAIAIGDIAAEKLSDPSHPPIPWLLGTILWFALTVAVDLLVLKNRRLAKLIEGEPTIVMENGRILEKEMFKNFLRVDGLMARLRDRGIFNPADVEYAIFETDGTITVLPKSQVRPVQPRDLKIATQYEGMSRELVVEGNITQNTLDAIGLSRSWLLGELQKAGYDDPKRVLYAAIDTQGKLFIDGYDDQVSGSRVRVEDYGAH